MIPDRLYFLEGAEFLLHKQEVRTLPFPENETKSTAINLFTQLDAIVSPTQTLTASFHFAPFLHDVEAYIFGSSWTLKPATFHDCEQCENEGEFRARPVLLQDASGHLLQRIDFTDGKRFGLSDTEPAVYLQDHWVLNGRFALDIGFRIEAQTVTHTVRNAPRAGFVWTPDRRAKTVLRGGIGIFYDSVPLDVYAFNNYPQQIITTYDASGSIRSRLPCRLLVQFC